jgi:hypothetical protein
MFMESSPSGVGASSPGPPPRELAEHRLELTDMLCCKSSGDELGRISRLQGYLSLKSFDLDRTGWVYIHAVPVPRDVKGREDLDEPSTSVHDLGPLVTIVKPYFS